MSFIEKIVSLKLGDVIIKLCSRVIALVAYVSSQEKKVPPRTPSDRMTTLKRFADSWIAANIAIGINRPDRALKMTDRIQLMTDKLELQYAQCGFFDPSVPHGGPRPARKRRSDEVNVFDRFEDALRERKMAENEVRLSNDVDLAWVQVGTGYRKWITRYMAECNGEKVYNYHTNRLNKVTSILHVWYVIHIFIILDSWQC